MNPWDVLTPVGTALSAIVGMYAVFIRPIRRDRKIAVVAEAERQRIRDEALDGLPEQPGMTGAVPPLVIRVAALEPAMNAVAAGQKLLERRMDEANGTTKRIETVVNDLYGANNQDRQDPRRRFLGYRRSFTARRNSGWAGREQGRHHLGHPRYAVDTCLSHREVVLLDCGKGGSNEVRDD